MRARAGAGGNLRGCGFDPGVIPGGHDAPTTILLLALAIVNRACSRDAHLVAIMQAYAVTNVLTFDVSHFSRFPGIRVLDPAHI